MVEEVNSWAYARNLLSVTMRIAARARTATDVLTASGFTWVAPGETIEGEEAASGARLALPISYIGEQGMHGHITYVPDGRAGGERRAADGFLGELDDLFCRKCCRLTGRKGEGIAFEEEPTTLLEDSWALIKHHPDG